MYDRALTPVEVDSLYNAADPAGLGIGSNGMALTSIAWYPNPVKDCIHFPRQVQVRLTNAAGQMILHRSDVDMLDLSDRAPGLYFLEFITKEGLVVQRSRLVKY